MIIKYNSDGIVEWAHAIGESGTEIIYSLATMSDGSYIAVGSFTSTSIDLGNDVILTKNSSNNYNTNGMIIKYSTSGKVEYAKIIGGTGSDSIISITNTINGGYIVGGVLRSASIDLGDGITLTNDMSKYNYTRGMLIKYNEKGRIEWAQEVGEAENGSSGVKCISCTSDGGYLIGGNIELANGVGSGGNGKIIKYNSNGELEWARGVGTEIETVVETSSGNYIAGGEFDSESVELENGTNLTNKREVGRDNYAYGGMIIEFENTELPNPKVQEAQRIGGTKDDRIKSVEKTNDGGYIIGGTFNGYSIDLGEGTILTKKSFNYAGIVAKYNAKDRVEWAKVIGGTRS